MPSVAPSSLPGAATKTRPPEGGPILVDVLRRDVERQHEPVRALEGEGVRARLVGLEVARHEDEAVVTGRAPVLEVLDDDRVVRHSGEAMQLDLAGLPAVETRPGEVLVGLPGVDAAFGR